MPIALGFRLRAGSPVGRTAGRGARLWGIAATLLLTTALALGAARWPTRVIEFEDGYVAKDRGRVTPPLWVVHRPAYPSGWALPVGGRLTAPVVPGGERVAIRLAARVVGRQGEEGEDAEYWLALEAGLYTTSLDQAVDDAGREAAAERAEAINRRVSGWAYRIPKFNHDAMNKRMDDLVQEVSGEE